MNLTNRSNLWPLGESDKERRAAVDIVCTDESGTEFVVVQKVGKKAGRKDSRKVGQKG